MTDYADWTIDVVAEFITADLERQSIPYMLEKHEGMMIIWLDKKKDFGCKIDDLDISICHLIGGKTFNLGFIKIGVVQFGVGVSISPISIIRHTNTNIAITGTRPVCQKNY